MTSSSIKTSHIIGAIIVLYLLDKWLDRKVKSYIDYFVRRTNHHVEQFQPFEAPTRVYDGRMYPDSPHLMQNSLQSMMKPQADTLTPLSSISDWTSTDVPYNQVTQTKPIVFSDEPRSTKFIPISDASATQKQVNGTQSWYDQLGAISSGDKRMAVEDSTPLIELDASFQQRALSSGQQSFDQMMTELDSDDITGSRLQDSAMMFSQ